MLLLSKYIFALGVYINVVDLGNSFFICGRFVVVINMKPFGGYWAKKYKWK
jgi:hypothetical protein